MCVCYVLCVCYVFSHLLPVCARLCFQVLPRVMEQIISCKDDIAQQYLFQVRPTTPQHLAA